MTYFEQKLPPYLGAFLALWQLKLLTRFAFLKMSNDFLIMSKDYFLDSNLHAHFLISKKWQTSTAIIAHSMTSKCCLRLQDKVTNKDQIMKM